MKKFIQKENYPIGDCFRTCFASILNCENLDDIPNFMKDGEGSFKSNFLEWMIDSGYRYIELEADYFAKVEFNPFIFDGYCILVGKSPRGDYNHAVIGKVISKGYEWQIEFCHDPSPFSDGSFLDGDVKYIGVILKSI